MQIYLDSARHLNHWFPQFIEKRLGYPQFPQLAQAPRYLQECKLLNMENFRAIIAHEQPLDMAWSIVLRKENLPIKCLKFMVKTPV